MRLDKHGLRVLMHRERTVVAQRAHDFEERVAQLFGEDDAPEPDEQRSFGFAARGGRAAGEDPGHLH